VKREPKKITPDPIIEAVVEVRFSSKLPRDAVFGIVYSALKDDFNPPKNLPILQLPDAVRSQDPNLKYQGHYSLSSKKLSVMISIGPQVISFINSGSYIGWNLFFPFICDILDKLENLDVISNPERIGIRYLNKLQKAHFEKIAISVNYDNQRILNEKTHIRTEIKKNQFIQVVNIDNNAVLNTSPKKESILLVDIDCVFNFQPQNTSFFSKYKKILTDGHNSEKETFFSIMTEEIIGTLNPEY
jgi:uncharacterized protein (TIGR04255 family)